MVPVLLDTKLMRKPIEFYRKETIYCDVYKSIYVQPHFLEYKPWLLPLLITNLRPTFESGLFLVATSIKLK